MVTFNILCSSVLATSRLCRTKIKHWPQPTIFYFSSTRFISKDNSQKTSLPKTEDNYCKKTIFQGHQDIFNGVTVHSNSEKLNDESELAKKLENSLEFWKNNGNRGVWFRVHISQSEWIPILVKNGFKFHHVNDEFVSMYLWLPHTEKCRIPHYAHTLLGVGAFVVNEKSQVLVVKERRSYFGQSFWKLPGGYVEPGENLVDATIREVQEETGIVTEFHSILALSQMHKGIFKCSDMYIVLSLRPLSDDIQKCDKEIAECKWIEMDDYLNSSDVHELSDFIAKKYLYYKENNIQIDCVHGIHQFLNKPYMIYSVANSEKDDKLDGQAGKKMDQD